MLVRLLASVSAAGSGTHPSMAETMLGEVPHDTCGLMADASSVSVRKKRNLAINSPKKRGYPFGTE